MSGNYGAYGDDDFETKGRRKISYSNGKPLRKVLEKELIEEGEYQGFSNYDDLNRYCEELDYKNIKDEEMSGDVNDLANIEGVSYAVRW